MKSLSAVLSIVSLVILIPLSTSAYPVDTPGGTANKIPKFNGLQTIVNSILSEISGNSFLVNGSGSSSIDADCDYCSVLGGWNVDITSDSYGSTICGGTSNLITDSNYSTIVSGGSCTIDGCSSCVIGGGLYSQLTDSMRSVIGGGYNNVIEEADNSVIGGGSFNQMAVGGNNHCVTAGGYNNDINATNAQYIVISGGRDNIANADYSTICGGYSNYVIGTGSTAWGYDNYASGSYSTAGGRGSRATGTSSTAIGYYAEATAHYSTALGHQARTDDAYSFVWSDGSVCYSTNTNQFKVCADNQVYFDTDTLYVTGVVDADYYYYHSPYPENLEVAYDAVMSLQRLPDGSYDPKDTGQQLDHSYLHDFIRRENSEGEIVGELVATTMAQNEVIKDLIARIAQLEQMCAK